MTGLALAAGGFALAAPWTAFLAGCALVIAYRVLPRTRPSGNLLVGVPSEP